MCNTIIHVTTTMVTEFYPRFFTFSHSTITISSWCWCIIVFFSPFTESTHPITVVMSITNCTTVRFVLLVFRSGTTSTYVIINVFTFSIFQILISSTTNTISMKWSITWFTTRVTEITFFVFWFNISIYTSNTLNKDFWTYSTFNFISSETWCTWRRTCSITSITIRMTEFATISWCKTIFSWYTLTLFYFFSITSSIYKIIIWSTSGTINISWTTTCFTRSITPIWWFCFRWLIICVWWFWCRFRCLIIRCLAWFFIRIAIWNSWWIRNNFTISFSSTWIFYFFQGNSLFSSCIVINE